MASSHDKPKQAGESGKIAEGTATRKTKDRRREVVLAAYQTLSETGFEGLRMRAIAKRAGLDHATLHYYFSGKEALIHGVLDYIVQDLSIGRGSTPEADGAGPRGQLAAHFKELIGQIRERPAMFVVLAEIHVRSMRDPTIRSVVSEYDRSWKLFLTKILREGIQQKEFYASIDPELAAEVIISLVRGLSVTFARNTDAMKQPLDQLLRWLEN